MKSKTPKGYRQPRYSVQLCWLINNNLISSIDAMEYAEIAGGAKMEALRPLLLDRIEKLYNRRGGPALPAACTNPADKFEKHSALFEHLFKAPLSMFMSPLLASVRFKSFDIVAFDKWLRVPDGTSTRDFIVEKYGKDAGTLVKTLL